ncbi:MULTISPECIES: acyltransferase [Vibrio]|nr:MULTISPECIES: acyltransferase [Vibrio]MBT0044281.1 acyltransferase [Vibrio alginolyticus]URQ94066.1 acyltransferase [Vibrio sp. SCSIO 43097]
MKKLRLSMLFKKIKTMFFTWFASKRVGAIGHNPKINGYTRFNNQSFIGHDFNSNGLRVLGRGKVTIGHKFHCGFGGIILTENHEYKNSNTLPYGSDYDVRNVDIGNNVWLGINVTILPGVSIGEGAIVQAGSTVVEDIPPLAICGGHPAKVFSYRDLEHYTKLKESENFL